MNRPLRPGQVTGAASRWPAPSTNRRHALASSSASARASAASTENHPVAVTRQPSLAVMLMAGW